MSRDPDKVRTTRDMEVETINVARRLQEEEDERFARELSYGDKRQEQERQTRLHEERREAKAKLEVEAARKKLEQERVKQREELKRKQREEKLSKEKMQATTKQCPGCQWSIEKSGGCDHMKCINAVVSLAGAAGSHGELIIAWPATRTRKFWDLSLFHFQRRLQTPSLIVLFLVFWFFFGVAC